MKTLKIILVVVLGLACAVPSLAQRSRGGGELAQAMKMSRQGQYREASELIFRLIQNPAYAGRQNQLRYLLGLMFFNMKMYQTAAFQFMNVVSSKRGKYVKQGLEKLSLAADHLGDDTLLNYAIAKIRVRDFPKQHADVLFYRLGEFQMRQSQFSGAVRSFNQVKTSSPLHGKAKYLQALSYVELGQNRQALRTFNVLLNARTGAAATDDIRVAAMMGVRVCIINANSGPKRVRCIIRCLVILSFGTTPCSRSVGPLCGKGVFDELWGIFKRCTRLFIKRLFFQKLYLCGLLFTFIFASLTRCKKCLTYLKPCTAQPTKSFRGI